MSPLAQQVSEMRSSLRRVARDDRRTALFLAAYYSKRALALDEPLRSETLADLATYASRASEVELADANRYGELRAALRDLGERLASLPARSGVPSARLLDDVVTTNRRAQYAATAKWWALGVGALLFVLGLFATRGPLGSIVLGVGVLLVVAARPLSWLERALAQAAVTAVERAGDATAAETMRDDCERTRDALLEGSEGAWLRALVAAHSALTFPELALTRSTTPA